MATLASGSQGASDRRSWDLVRLILRIRWIILGGLVQRRHKVTVAIKGWRQPNKPKGFKPIRPLRKIEDCSPSSAGGDASPAATRRPLPSRPRPGCMSLASATCSRSSDPAPNDRYGSLPPTGPGHPQAVAIGTSPAPRTGRWRALPASDVTREPTRSRDRARRCTRRRSGPGPRLDEGGSSCRRSGRRRARGDSTLRAAASTGSGT